MGYQALITIDLPGATDGERNKFYNTLKKSKWEKLTNLSSAWQVEWGDDVNRDEATKDLKTAIKNTKFLSEVNKVNYAFQVGKGSVEVI